jgi:REP element-mobilizing transposase RayT
MARKLRLEYPGAIYHLMSRGDRREPIYLDEADRRCFLETLSEACEKTAWQVHVYCLMENHFHLVCETPQPNLVAGMKWLLGTYTGRFNRRHKYSGHLFSGRYKALVVDGSSQGYLRTVCEYVHLNPVRSHLLGPDEALSAYPWSSYPAYLQARSLRPCWLRVDRVLGENGIPGDTLAGRERFEQVMEQRRAEATEAGYKPIRRGWCFGEARFREELLAQVSGQLGANHFGEERQESAEQKAMRLIEEDLRKLGWIREQLRSQRVSDPDKIEIARRLRRETTMDLKWIASQLGMDSWRYLS